MSDPSRGPLDYASRAPDSRVTVIVFVVVGFAGLLLGFLLPIFFDVTPTQRRGGGGKPQQAPPVVPGAAGEATTEASR